MRETTSILPPWVERLHAHRGLIVPLGFVFLLSVILVPLPPVAMDLLISLNISLAVIVLMTTIYMKRALDFSVFPSLLLATTLLRLVLNIASTRLILTADADSPEAAMGVAGQVISAFGSFVAGNSLFVGVIIFTILMLVQFMVVTKGAGRIAEVAARFTLDAMPGKQMAVDAELANGILSEDEAKEKREEIAREADFYGSMDGASKFVRGDAVAGIIITLVNIAGGFAVGIIERGWPAGQTAEVFTKLTIGDGLTSQIPSLIISIAAALIVTRSGSKSELGEELTGQLTSQPRGLTITAGFLAALAITPLPTIPLLATSIALGALAFGMSRVSKRRAADDAVEQRAAAAAPASSEPPPVESLLKVDVLELEVGYGLVPLIDQQQGGDLLDRITAVRRQLAAEMGLVMPPVRIRDNVQLEPTAYRVKIRGAVVAEGKSQPGKLLAMDSGLVSGTIGGEATKEPAFGLDAVWIEQSQRIRAESMNYTVVDPTSVIATHITELVRTHADELLTREEVNNLVEGLKERSPRLVEEAIPGLVKVGEIQKILQSLLRERAPIRDMEAIVETLADWAPKTKDTDVLVEYVRHALRRSICQPYLSRGQTGDEKLLCVTLDPAFEDVVNAYIDRGQQGTVVSMPARVSSQLSAAVQEGLAKLSNQGYPSVVIASPQVRAVVHQMLSPHVPGGAVLGYNEVAGVAPVESLALITPPVDGASTQAQQPVGAA